MTPRRDAPSRILVIERAPYWAPELQRQFPRTAVSVEAAPQWPVERKRLGEKADLFVVEVDSGPKRVVRGLADLAAEQERPRVVIVVSEQTAPLEWTLRELGADAVLDEFAGGEKMAAVCRRLLLSAAQPR